MGTIGRITNAAALSALVLAVALPAQPELHLFAGGECQDPAACRQNADVGAMVDEMIADQVKTFQCRPAAKGTFPSSALVRHARMADGDTGVVARESSAVAWAEAKAGHIYVARWCR